MKKKDTEIMTTLRKVSHILKLEIKGRRVRQPEQRAELRKALDNLIRFYQEENPTITETIGELRDKGR
jgi:hypothetical protein